MNQYVIIGIVGIVLNLLAALADVPLVKPGKPDPNEIFTIREVNPWWKDVTDKRFILSFWLSFLGQPGAYLVMWFLADLISGQNEPLALALRINTFIGCYTGLLCHVAYCIKPLVYRRICNKMSDDTSAEVLKAIDPLIKFPLIIGFISLWLGGTVIVSIAILTGALPVSKMCLLLNPVVSIIVLMLLKKLGVRIIGPLGVGFMLFSVLLIIAGTGV